MSTGHNGGPPLAVDSDDVKMSWIRLDIADFKRGIANMDMELRGFYISILVEMYDSKGRLPNDLTLLGKRFGTTARVMRRVVELLVSEGKLYVAGDSLRNRRCDEERERLIAEYCRRHAAAVKREAAKREAESLAEVSGKFQQSLAEVSPKLSQNIGMFDESLDQTFGDFKAKSKDHTPQPCQTSDHTCGEKKELRTKKEEDREERKKVTHVTARGVPDELRVFESYNEMAQRLGLPLASTLTPARRRCIAARLREHGGFEAWERARANVERSSFLQGGGDKGWRMPGFDWLFGPKNFVKVFEGAYGNGAHAKAAPKETEWERMSRLMGEPSRIDDIEIIPPARRL